MEFLFLFSCVVVVLVLVNFTALSLSLWSFDFIKWSQIIATIDITHFDSFEHRLIFINSTNSMKWAGVIYFGREKKIFAKQLNLENYATWWCLVYERTRLYFIYIFFSRIYRPCVLLLLLGKCELSRFVQVSLRRC